MLNDPSLHCSCGAEQIYADCCGKFIKLSQQPSNPEQLMRSRYCAYVVKNEDYLLKSWHHSTRPSELKLNNDSTQWLRLKIISSVKNKVEFVAYFTNNTKNIYSLYEESEFVKEKERWFYLKGNNLKTTTLTKNIPCPCRSGKKFKRCCHKYL